MYIFTSICIGMWIKKRGWNYVVIVEEGNLADFVPILPLFSDLIVITIVIYINYNSLDGGVFVPIVD